MAAARVGAEGKAAAKRQHRPKRLVAQRKQAPATNVPDGLTGPPRRWEGLTELTVGPAGFQLITKGAWNTLIVAFCEDEHSDENVKFLMAVDRFRSAKDAKTAKAIVDSYIGSDAPEAMRRKRCAL